MNRLTKNVIFITGASSGIGRATALAAASQHIVIATVRSESSKKNLLEAAKKLGVDVHVKLLDATDHSAILACIEQIITEFGRLDALINNAGIGHVGTIENESLADVREVMEVNFFSVVAMTKAALPYLRDSLGTVLTITSVGGIVGQPFNEAYCASKFAVEGFMESLAPVVKTAGVRVVVIEPGAVASQFVENIAKRPEDMIADAGIYTDQLAGYVQRVMGQFDANAQQPDEVASIIVNTLTQDEPPLRLQTSDAARALTGLKLSDSDGSKVQAVTSKWLASS